MKRLDDAGMRARLKRPLQHVPADYAQRSQLVHSRQLFRDIQPVDTTEVLQKIQQLKSRDTTKVSTPTPRQTIMMVPHRPQPSRVLMRPSFTTTALPQAQDSEYRPTLVVRLRRKLWRVPSRS